MKTIRILFIAIITAGFFTSCGEDFLTASSTNSKPYGTDPVTEQSINENLAAAYHILLRDNYASGYNSVLLLSDMRGDDCFKGGESAGDQRQFVNLSTFTCNPTQNIYGFWQLFYRGVARCNETVANANLFIEENGATDKVKSYKAEALFLRAYFMHWIWLNWGNVPYPKALTTQETQFIAEQYTVDEVYERLIEDIAECEALGALQMASYELGRVNLAAVYMLKAIIVMYQKDNSKYNEIAANMASIINSGVYGLMDDFDKMWLQEGEFCKENIFETNAGRGGTAWGTSAGNPYGFGTNFPRFIGPRNFNDPNGEFEEGWGFGPVRPYLYRVANEQTDPDGKAPLFESAADVRRTASVNYFDVSLYVPAAQDTRGYWYRKYARRAGYNAGTGGDGDINFVNNMRIFRYAETLLNYAELVGVMGASASGGVLAQNCLDQVRTRANVASIAVNQENIELERHREFIGEGKRYWDLIRWDKAASTLTENFIQPSADKDGQPASFVFSRTWDPAKSKYLPIPVEEVNARLGTPYEIIQNPF